MLHVFIINSFAGRSGISERIREALKKKENFEYLVFNSEYPGHESILANKIYDLFPDDTIRFYSCGGSGTIRNILSGLPDLKRAQFAEFPCGATNDFLAIFGKKRDLFKNLDNLIDGKVMELDYIETNSGRAHNTVSSGFDVQMVRALETLSALPFGVDRSSYALAAIIAFFGPSHLNCRIEADGENCDTMDADMVIIGNGRVLGGSFHISDSNSVVDGELDVIVIPRVRGFLKFRCLVAFLRSDWGFIIRHCHVKKAKRINCYPLDDKGFVANFDGEIVTSSHLEARVCPRGMKFVVPWGAVEEVADES